MNLVKPIANLTIFLGFGLFAATSFAYQSNLMECSNPTGDFLVTTDYFAETTFDNKLTYHGEVLYQMENGVVTKNRADFSAKSYRVTGMPSSTSGKYLTNYYVYFVKITKADTQELIFSDFEFCSWKMGAGKYQSN